MKYKIIYFILLSFHFAFQLSSLTLNTIHLVLANLKSQILTVNLKLLDRSKLFIHTFEYKYLGISQSDMMKFWD